VKTEGDFGNSESRIELDHFNRFDYGVSFGSGVDLGGVEIGARYSLGLREVADDQSAGILVGNSKNSMLEAYLMLGL
jgi:hypothetical protein